MLRRQLHEVDDGGLGDPVRASEAHGGELPRLDEAVHRHRGHPHQLGDLRGKRVLVRSDLNVPLDGSDDDLAITDDGRVRASVPTIAGLAEAGARVIVVAHLGRPKGEPEARYSLRPVATRLGELKLALEAVDKHLSGGRAKPPKGVELFVTSQPEGS